MEISFDRQKNANAISFTVRVLRPNNLSYQNKYHMGAPLKVMFEVVLLSSRYNFFFKII